MKVFGRFTWIDSWCSVSIICLPRLMPVCVLIIGFITVLHSPISIGGACLADNRKLMVSNNVVRIRSYVCEVDNATDIRVEFHRLSDAIVGDLIMVQESLLMRKAVGKFEIHNNAVYDATKALFEQFGSQTADSRFWSAPDAGGTRYFGNKVDQGIKITTHIGNNADYNPFPLPQVMRMARSGQTWFQDFNFFYKNCPEESPDYWYYYGCLKLWRPMTREDAKKYARNWSDLNVMLGGNIDANSKPNLDIDLLLHLTKEGWPTDFSYIFGEFGVHDSIEFSYVPRRMFLDVAVIENLSDTTVSLDSLYGTNKESRLLRPVKKLQDPIGSCTKLNAKALVQLGPNEKLLVPLRMVFTNKVFWDDDSSIGYINQLTKAAQATYERIRSADPGPQGFSYPNLRSREYSDNPDVGFITALKSPEDYKEPVFPVTSDYAFGPEISLCKIEVNGKRSDLIDKQENTLEVTTSDEKGSCPYLFAWSELSNQWVSYGKIIHEALDKQRQDKEGVKLVEFATRFRITEKELELSHIDMARLQIVTRDGRTNDLMPNIAALTQVDEVYADIYAGDSIEFEFQLPGAIVKDDILSATLIVNGYYQLYTSPEILSRLPPLPASE